MDLNFNDHFQPSEVVRTRQNIPTFQKNKILTFKNVLTIHK